MSAEKMNDPQEIAKLVQGRRPPDEQSKAGKKQRPKSEQKKAPAGAGDQAAAGEAGRQPDYFMAGGFLCRRKPSKDGDLAIRLANFDARITAENLNDDGLEQTRCYEIEGRLYGKTPLPMLEVAAANFPGMTWTTRWGARCCLESGQTVRDSVRHAIQSQSDKMSSNVFFSHTGWRTIGGKLLYLHGGGAVGGDGNVSIKLPPELQRYTLPPAPPTGPEQAAQIREAAIASLGFLDLGWRSVMLPLFAFIHLAPLVSRLQPQPGFSFFLHGSSGTFKTTIAVLALNFFGSFPGSENLSNFSDSDGAVEMRAFTLMDSLLVCDDLHPSSNRAAALLQETRLQRLIRSFGNRTSRGRLNSDLTAKPRYAPRGLLLCTGEEQPALESSIARTCVVELVPGSISKTKLTAAQDNAGLLSAAMRSYIEWLASHMKEIVAEFPQRFKELRAEASGNEQHGRLPEQVSFLQFSMEKVVAWLVECRAVSDTGAEDLLNESWIAFQNLSASQMKRIANDDPVDQFFQIIGTLITQQKVRLLSTFENQGEQILATGGEVLGAHDVIGHYDDKFIYLDPVGVWNTVQRFCIMEGTHFPFSKNTFYRMLLNRGLVQASAANEPTMSRKIDGKTCRVLKVIGGGLFEKLVANVAK